MCTFELTSKTGDGRGKKYDGYCLLVRSVEHANCQLYMVQSPLTDLGDKALCPCISGHFMPKVKRHTQQISAFDCLLVSLNTLASLLSGAQAMLLSALHSFSCSAVPVVDWKRAVLGLKFRVKFC
eukprot:1137470-Pelagomonas_calceolata.AAC.2